MKFLRSLFYSSILLASNGLAAVPVWTKPFSLYSTPDSNNLLVNPAVSIDSNGKAVALYPTIYNIKTLGASAAISNSGVISYPSVIDISGFNGGNEKDRFCNRVVAMDAAGTGNAMAAWVVYNSNLANFDLYVAQYTAESGLWSTPVSLVNNSDCQITNSNITPQIYFDSESSPTALVLFPTYREIGSTVFWSKCTSLVNNTWSTPVTVGGNATSDIKPLFIGTSSELFFNDTNSKINRMTFDGSSWSIEYVSTALSAGNLKASFGQNKLFWVNANGNIMITYNDSNEVPFYIVSQNDGTSQTQYASQEVISLAVADNDYSALFITRNTAPITGAISYTLYSSTHIDSLKELFTTTDTLSNLQMASNNNQNACFIVWESDDSQGNGTIWAGYINFSLDGNNFYTTPLSTEGASCKSPCLSLGSNGNAIVAWIKNGVTVEAVSTTPNTYANTYQNNQTTWFECANAPTSNTIGTISGVNYWC